MATSTEKGKGRAIEDTFDEFQQTGNAFWDEALKHKTFISATVGSLCSTFLGFPLDSLKSRMQATRGSSPRIHQLATEVFREEGIRGFWRGALIPLLSISVVRTTSFSIYTGTKNELARKNILATSSLRDIWVTSFISGCTSGASISICSTPFELIKVRRQLEVMISQEMGIIDPKPMTTRQSVQAIVSNRGWAGMYTGFGPHFIRDTLGTGLYFAEYDALRSLFGRLPSGEQGDVPSWLPITPSLVPFFCGSVAGVSSWALIYPVDAIKTRMQKRALSNKSYRGIWETFGRIAKGPDSLHPQPMSKGFMQLYRGLGVSAARSCLTHGLLWFVIDNVSSIIDRGSLSPMSSQLKSQEGFKLSPNSPATPLQSQTVRRRSRSRSDVGPDAKEAVDLATQSKENVFLFVPNLIGYSRIILAGISLWVMPNHPKLFTALYFLSSILDVADGHAARALKQTSKFGAVLDMVTDRSATACLLAHLAGEYPAYALLFQFLIALDFSSHYMHMYSSLATGSTSHKLVTADVSRILWLYYNDTRTLFVFCFANETFFVALYLIGSGPEWRTIGLSSHAFSSLLSSIGLSEIVPKLAVGWLDLVLGKLSLPMIVALLCFPICVGKQIINVVQFWKASKILVGIDLSERAAARQLEQNRSK
ncbi:mitochondrial carrier [Phaffia rhodozyma]|uniref:Mitochondrial carrier n=1 Tax=Phaffia rhodozyma TaxID=264483 RepID=A0A0F7SET0_PHARH|nr:mitochondrial carrier [Phaffia rhodozyma]